MLGKTHLTIGMATALVVAQPSTVPGVVAALAAGGIGGKLPDIDIKSSDPDKESVLDSIIDGLFIAALIGLDYLSGNGICQYTISNWGIKIWIGLFLFAVLCIIGFLSPHRSFTHSILSLGLFSAAVYIYCRPAAIAFALGYASHLFIDLFNKKREKLLYPIKRGFCLNLCDAKGKANKVLYWIGFAIDIIAGGYFFSMALFNNAGEISFNTSLLLKNVLGLNLFQWYLIAINLISFIGFQHSYHNAYREAVAERDKNVRIQLEFETWLLDFTVFIGGGIGMLLVFIIHREFPCGYNGNWWAICYTSILVWFTLYSYICNPFNMTMNGMVWLNIRHIIPLIYLVVVNIISFIAFNKVKKRHLNEYNPLHTLLWLIGAAGGTIGAYPAVILAHRDNSFNYAVFGFPMMLVGQMIAIFYCMSAGII